jgi:hypothetical protein
MLVRSVTQTQKAETLLIDLSDGQLTTQIIETSQVKNIKVTPAPKKTSKNKSDNKQGQLF